jgi:hypothetical protein
VLSPTISGTLRDFYNSWAPAVYLDAFLIFASFVILLFVREAAPEPLGRAQRAGAEPAPGVA